MQTPSAPTRFGQPSTKLVPSFGRRRTGEEQAGSKTARSRYTGRVRAVMDTNVDCKRAQSARQVGAAWELANSLPGANVVDDRVKWGEDTKLKNQVQLSAYPNCIGGDLKGLQRFITKHLEGVVGGVHVLPFYPSSADRGFAPLTYKEVDPEVGDWSSIDSIQEGKDLCVDFMVNHTSAQSDEFKDYVQHGDKSAYADLFINWHKFWGGEPSQEDVDRIYSRKPEAPTREVEHPDGSKETVWCTFSPEQIDMNVFSETGDKFIGDQIKSLAERGVNLIRLDAFGYTTKKKGTNCFFTEPEIWDLLERIRAKLGETSTKTELLCEVHEHYCLQKLLAERGLWVYDFALPMLCLQGLWDGDASNLKAWLLKCPRNQVTTLDTHDGIGIVDVADLMTQSQIERTQENVYKHGANANKRYSTSAYGNLDTYQMNCAYYSAVGNDDRAYLLARAIQFFTPGIPLVYYVGLLAGANDIERVESTKVGRDINRHEFSEEEAAGELDRPVVQLLFELCRFRNRHPAFDGTFELLDTLTHVRDAVTISDRTMPTAAPEEQEAQQQRDHDELEAKKKKNGGFLENDCGCKAHVVDSEKDWSLTQVLNGRDLAEDKPTPNGGSERFRTYSPALQNLPDDTLSTPKCNERGKQMSQDEQEKECEQAMRRKAKHDLPRDVLCMKWSKDEHWAVLEASVRRRVFRILYSDPRDGRSKVWNVSCTYKSLVHASESD